MKNKNKQTDQHAKIEKSAQAQNRTQVGVKDAGAQTNYNADDNEGEGSRTADRKYREGVEKFSRENDVEKLAREADVDMDAEQEGKRHIAEEDPELRR